MSKQPYPQLWRIWQMKQTSTFAAICTFAIALTCAVSLPFRVRQSIDKVATVCVGLAAAESSRRLAYLSLDLRDTDADMTYAERRSLIGNHVQVLKTEARKEEPTTLLPADADNVITDAVQYWLAQEKHLLLIGGTGAGKTRFIDGFTKQLRLGNYESPVYAGVPWKIHVYDVDATVDDWSQANSVFQSVDMIELAMRSNIDVLPGLRTIRQQAGSRKWKPDECVLFVADEFPALVTKPKVSAAKLKDMTPIWDTAAEWLSTHAKQSRKLGRFCCAIAQNDTVSNFGLTGDSKVLQNSFVRIYLSRTKEGWKEYTQDEAVLQWLNTREPFDVCIIDDQPAYRPR